MILEIPDEYREALIGFLELGLTYIDQIESQEETLLVINPRTGTMSKEQVKRANNLDLAGDELAVIEIVKDFIEREG